MASWEEKANELYSNLKKRNEESQSPSNDFSIDAMKEFCWWFEIIIFGTIVYLKESTAGFNKAECLVTCNQFTPVLLKSRNDYDNLLREMLKISPPAEVEFKFTFKEGTYLTGDFEDSITVYFKHEKYQILYQNEDSGQLEGFDKTFDSKLTENEINSIQVAMKENVFRRITLFLKNL